MPSERERSQDFRRLRHVRGWSHVGPRSARSPSEVMVVDENRGDYGVEAIFDVKVTRVNIINMPTKLRRFLGRPGRTSPWKKAIVTLSDGHAIDFT